MGTDIHIITEVRKNGKWKTSTKEIFDGWDEGEKTCIPYLGRNYDLFAILANVRNGRGFSNCKTGQRFEPIAMPRGLPSDMDPESDQYLSGDHDASYLTLDEIVNYPHWNKTHHSYGIVTEEEYKNTVMQGKHPTEWCGGCWGASIVMLSEGEMKQLIEGTLPRQEGKDYRVQCKFVGTPYKEKAGYFYEKTIPLLMQLIPEGGTASDVRIVFDFDS